MRSGGSSTPKALKVAGRGRTPCDRFIRVLSAWFKCLWFAVPSGHGWNPYSKGERRSSTRVAFTEKNNCYRLRAVDKFAYVKNYGEKETSRCREIMTI